MKNSHKLCLLLISIFIFLLKIDNVNAKTISCEYEMYPVGYYIKNNTVMPYSSSSIKSSAKLTYSATGKKDYELKHNTTLGGQEIASFKDNAFAKKVWNNNECPSYVEVDAKSPDYKVDSLTQSEFDTKQNTFMSNTKKCSTVYPMFLTKKNGKTVTKYAIHSTELALTQWATIIERGENTSIMPIANTYRDAIVNNSELYSSIRSNKNWKTFSTFALNSSINGETEKKLEEVLAEYDAASADYCYYYCENKCQYRDSTCKPDCEANDKPKCTEAYNACAVSAAQNECLHASFSSKGLDTNYITIHDQEMTSLAEEKEKLSKSVEVARAAQLKIENSPYKLTCDDVKIFHQIWVIIVIIAPILAILMGTLDFGKAVVSSKVDDMQKAWKKFPKRLLAAVFLFLIPLLISLLLNLTTNEAAKDTNLMYCIINGGE